MTTMPQENSATPPSSQKSFMFTNELSAPATSLISSGGFSLNYMEILNWGTFDGCVWRLDSQGESALITGANGSGKSTIVDALITLLVTNNRRNYNLSSGNARKERSESTYVRGVYGRAQDSTGLAKIKYCRSEQESYSVLLAQFQNPVYYDSMCLAQFFWYDKGELKKFFITSLQPLSIEKHFSHFQSPQELRKKLKALPHTQVYDNFGEYQLSFLGFFGPKSLKAMDLFNQVVAIKEVSHLSDFVRKHMLEPQNVQDLIDQLFLNYENLNVAYKAITQARGQLELLSPIGESAKTLQTLQIQYDDLLLEERKIPLYFNLQRKESLQNQIQNSKRELEEKEHEQQLKHQAITSLQERCNQLSISIRQDDSGQEVDKVQMQIQQAQEKRKLRLQAYTQYETLAKKLSLTTKPDIKNYTQTQSKLKVISTQLEEEIATLSEQTYQVRKDLDRSQEKVAHLTEEITLLKNTKGNIPTPFVKMRDELCQYLGVKKSDLPFIAELIQVRSDEKKKWNHAIEKLLRSLGLRMLVPSDLYTKVNKYLTKTSIGIKLIYNKVDLKEYCISPDPRGLNGQSLLLKLDFQNKSPYAKWVNSHIAKEFDYICTEDFEQFQISQKALMPSGLMKRNHSLHEKDDRWDQGMQSLLGWDNSQKLSEIQELYSQEKSGWSELNKKSQFLEKQNQEKKNLLLAVRDLSHWDDFSMLDWESCAEEIEKLKRHKEKLSTGTLPQLQKDFDHLKSQMAQLQSERDQILSEITLLKQILKNGPEEIKICDQIITKILEVHPFDLHIENLFKETEKYLKKKKIDFVTIKSDQMALLQREISDSFHKEKAELEQKIESLHMSLLKKMTQFKIKFSEYALDLNPSMDYLPEYLNLLDKLQKESLPEHEKRFKTLLNKSAINDMAAFKSTLELAYDEILESVNQLNESLKKIPYSDTTYVQLNINRSKDIEIREFSNMLRNALKLKTTDASDKEIKNIDLEESFNQIKKILDRMKADPSWCKSVTDVRNWADFYVLELSHADHSQKNYYADSAGLSGGQKAKLAFTILASAIAFQYGLHKPNAKDKSFRFVVIDEAFSKSDESNSKYAMDLFKRLGLQLFVVTPMDKIHIVEPFIKNIFVTSINSEYSQSKILNLTINEFRAIQ